jgi:SAM-dependent methyltransferase
MKTPDQVGKDFDEYARRWRPADYTMEGGWDGQQLAAREDKQAEVRLPGDEWGGLDDLKRVYASLFARLLPSDRPVNVLEIGAGGGRSTRAVLDVLGPRAHDYHVVDVSAAFVSVLKERIDRAIEVHVVSDVDLSALPQDHFDLCLAQSSWSHIGMYDQYRYLRDLRGVLAHGAPLVVNGQFLLGLGDDWAWNRFRRRVYQIEHTVEGVFHEFTGSSALVEQLFRLEYDIEVVHDHGFVARRRQSNIKASLDTLDAPMEYPYLRSLVDFAAGREPTLVSAR